ncbi:hypothetical protein COLO4_10085 [Corchorus olitorius]|uniref:Quinolinate phosphoribosyl transferase C-terminal domain-containing protein n=1 Tax=Corchorus olitorius TaxID=93759 RepID=A0A1R3KA12_9ROSI|nr:hypothetical protein COLO4_10085 [Corchorus olitorius]
MADAASPAYILETRKTAPGLRVVDKWTVLIGGGRNHRLGLFDMVLIKDNHISIAGGISNALRAVDQYLERENVQMEVEIKLEKVELPTYPARKKPERLEMGSHCRLNIDLAKHLTMSVFVESLAYPPLISCQTCDYLRSGE